jgi:2-phosphosulfolactate phosphatase
MNFILLMPNAKPFLYTSMSPALLHLYNASQATVVIIDVLRATSTVATALFNGARYIVPVDSVAKCIELGRQINCVTAGERDGKIAEGLSYGNSPFEYSRPFINGKILVLTTTNGTRLLHMALEKGAREIVTGSFVNLGAVTEYLLKQKNNVILACAAWKDRINIEDTLFAGALIEKTRDYFNIECDASHIAANLYNKASGDLFDFMQKNNASHFNRLMAYGLEKDIRYCLEPNLANVLPIYEAGKLKIY